MKQYQSPQAFRIRLETEQLLQISRVNQEGQDDISYSQEFSHSESWDEE